MGIVYEKYHPIRRYYQKTTHYSSTILIKGSLIT